MVPTKKLFQKFSPLVRWHNSAEIIGNAAMAIQPSGINYFDSCLVVHIWKVVISKIATGDPSCFECRLRPQDKQIAGTVGTTNTADPTKEHYMLEQHPLIANTLHGVIIYCII